MKQLLIIGARGFGREVYNLARRCHGFETEYVIKGFLDDKTDALEGFAGYPPIIDSVEHYEIQPDDVFICALGDVSYKRKYAEIILAKGGNFINLIHHRVGLDKNSTIGLGCIVCENVGISCDVKIGNFCTLMGYATLGHDVQIGNYCHLGVFSFMGGYVILEDEVTLHTSAIIHPHKTVEKGAIVGAGSVVIKRVKAGTTVMGNPAMRIEF